LFVANHHVCALTLLLLTLSCVCLWRRIGLRGTAVKHGVLGAIAAAAMLFVVGVARADEAADARVRYERGTTFYDLGRFADAAREYEGAYELKHEPALLFNIGQAYRFAHEYNKATIAFRAYLRHLPNAENRAEVEARITEMQRLAEEQRKSQERPPAGTIPPDATAAPNPPAVPPPRAVAPTEPPIATPVDHRRRNLGFGIAAGGIAVAIAGAALVGVGAATADRLNHPKPTDQYDPSAQSTMRIEQGTGIALLGVGGAALAAGTAIAVIAARREHAPRVTAAATVDRNSASAVVRVSF